jgi:hypothetical protein
MQICKSPSQSLFFLFNHLGMTVTGLMPSSTMIELNDSHRTPPELELVISVDQVSNSSNLTPGLLHSHY